MHVMEQITEEHQLHRQLVSDKSHLEASPSEASPDGHIKCTCCGCIVV